MALTAEILGKINCSGSILTAGMLGCKLNLKNIRHFMFFKRGVSITDLTREALRTLQQEGKLFILPYCVNAPWEPEENQRETFDSSGLMSRARAGNYSFTAQFNDSFYLHIVMNSMQGSDWDVILIDDQDTALATTPDGTTLKPLRVQMFDVNPYQVGQGSESAKSSFTVQLAKPAEINDRGRLISSESLGFLLSEVTPANQVNLSIASGLTDTSTSIVVKTVLESDMSTFVAGLDENDFLLTVNGSSSAITAATANANQGTYTLTVSALATDDEVTLKLWDSTAGGYRTIITGVAPDDVLYKSNEIDEVVIA